MWPWGHAAVGYLAYRAWVARTGRSIDGLAVVALAIGTQAPDLVDKPLGWYASVLPAGRSLGHSLLVATAVAAVAWSVARRDDRPVVAGAFALGYWAHLVTDSYHAVLTGEFGQLAFLAYPLVPVQPDPPGLGLLYLLRRLELTPFLAFEFLLTAVAIALWVLDDMPGLDALRLWIARRRAPG